MAGVKHTISVPLQASLASGLELYGTDGIRLIDYFSNMNVSAIWELNNAWTDSKSGFTLIPAGASNPDFDGANKKLGSHAADFGGKAADTRAYNAVFLDAVPITGFWFSAWIRFDATFDSSAGVGPVVISKANILNEDLFNLQFLQADGKCAISWEEHNNGQQIIRGTTTSWTGGTWYHLVMKWDTTDGVELWVNGSREANDAGATAIMKDGSATDFVIGNYASNPNFPFEGNVDSVVGGYSNLTSTYIAHLYNSGNGRELTKYLDTSPATTAGWTALPKGTLDMSTALCVVYKDGYEDGEVQADTSTDVKFRYYANGGGASAWMTLAAFKALSDIVITDTTSSFKMEAQYISDDSYQSASRAQVMIDFTPATSGSANQIIGSPIIQGMN